MLSPSLLVPAMSRVGMAAEEDGPVHAVPGLEVMLWSPVSLSARDHRDETSPPWLLCLPTYTQPLVLWQPKARAPAAAGGVGQGCPDAAEVLLPMWQPLSPGPAGGRSSWLALEHPQGGRAVAKLAAGEDGSTMPEAHATV